MSENISKLNLNINMSSEIDSEELANLTQQLRDELLETDLSSVDLKTEGEVPKGAKAGDPITWGSLLLTLSGAGGVITSLISVLQSWLSRNENSSISLEVNGNKLDIKGGRSKKQTEIITQWLEFNLKQEQEK